MSILQTEICVVCKRARPVEDFYDSERRKGRRCKRCFRARVDAANRAKGRRSTSLSLEEQGWLHALLRALPSSELRHLARRPEYARLSRKIAAMAASQKED